MNKDTEFIKKFSKITISSVVKESGLSSTSNIWSGKANPKTVEKVKKTIIKKVLILISEYE